MAKVLIVYASDHGGARKMAEALASGVDSVAGGQAKLMSAEEATSDDIMASDALVLGSAVHMASMHWQMKRFIDTQCSGLWMGDQIVGKVGAVFACGSGYGGGGGGCELAMLSMLGNLVELGLLIVPLPKNSPGYSEGGLHWGPYGRAHNEDLSPIEGGLPDQRTAAARQHGVNIARVTDAVAGKELFG